MKRFFILIGALIIALALSIPAYGDELEVVQCLVVTDKNGMSPDDLNVIMFLKNTRDTPVKLLTRNLQPELHLYQDRPIELHITFSSQMSFDGCLVIPSEYDLSPVTIGKDEVAEINIPYHDRKNLKEVVLVYDMRNDIAKRYEAWYGSVSGNTVEVMKFEGKP